MGILSPWFTGVGITDISRHLKTFVVARRQILGNCHGQANTHPQLSSLFVPTEKLYCTNSDTVFTVTILTIPNDFIKKKIRMKITLCLPSKNNDC